MQRIFALHPYPENCISKDDDHALRTKFYYLYGCLLGSLEAEIFNDDGFDAAQLWWRRAT